MGKGDTWIGDQLDEKMRTKLNKLNNIAEARGQTLSQMALAWVLHNSAATTVLIGASSPAQIRENTSCIDNLDFSAEEIAAVKEILK